MKKLPLLLSLTILVLTASPQEEGVASAYRRPTITVPYLSQAPTIDGVIDEPEWRGAESVRALQTTGKQLSMRQTRFWMGWDEDNLYVAMQSPLRPGERVIQAIRAPEREENVVFDDSYEVWLDVGSTDPKTGLRCFYQFLCNYAGARLDSIELPAVGNSRLTFETKWQPVNRIAEGNVWEMELVIPRASLGVETPFADGQQFTCLLARNYKRPWEQNSVEGTSSFSVLDTHSLYIMRKEVPAVHLLGVGDLAADTTGIKLAAYSAAATTIHWRYASDSGTVREGDLALLPGIVTAGPELLNLDPVAKGDFRITVTGADDQILLDWSARQSFGRLKDYPATLDDRGDVVALRPQFNPVHDYLRLSGDFINYDARAQIDKVHAAIADAAGKVLAEGDFRLGEHGYVRGVLRMQEVPYGTYTVTMTCLGADGQEILHRTETFEKKDHEKAFPWWNTTRGNIQRVIAPWTPVAYQGGVYQVWGREMHAGTMGLPGQVVTQGAELLAGPVRLVATLPDGTTAEPVAARVPPKVVAHEHQVDAAYLGALGALSMSSVTNVTFDGMVKMTLTLTPRQPVAVDSLKLVVPLKPEAAEYIHAVGEGIRTGYYYGFIPKTGNGQLWNCLTVDSQPMVTGSFIPYLWIGNTEGGLAWFADSDQGWVPSDTAPAIELRRDGAKSVDLVLNLISAPFTIDAPRTIAFAFQASPVKPMHAQWRMDSWWCGDTFLDYASSGSLIWNAIPYCRDNAKCIAMVEQRHKSSNRFIFGIDKYRANAVPYFIHQNLPSHLVPEMKYFGDEWRTSVSDCLYYGKTLTDYMVYNYSKWAEETGIDGYYVDNMRPVACADLDAGRGYRLPDGRIQPTYQMFSTREYFLRMRAAFAEQGKHHKIVLHMTNCMIIPWVGAADIAYDGEHHVIYPEMGKDFMDFWSLERLRVDHSGQWGVAVNFMHEYQGRWEKEALAQAMRAYTGLVGLHDALPSGNANGMNQPFWIARDRFGIEADDVRFIGYWDAAAAGIVSGQEPVKVSVWQRPGQLLLLVVNTGEATTAEVTLKLPTLIGTAEAEAIDAEAGTQALDQGAIGLDADGKLVVPVGRHDYRQIIVKPRVL